MDLRRLSLLRHAQAANARPEQRDWDRELRPRGQREAIEMARQLRKRNLIPQQILSSPAVRALQTARILVEELELDERLIQQDEGLYLAPAQRMLELARLHGGNAGHFMIVGHNPGISELADQLSSERRIDAMPTCGLCTLIFALDDWQALDWDSGVQVELASP